MRVRAAAAGRRLLTLPPPPRAAIAVQRSRGVSLVFLDIFNHLYSTVACNSHEGPCSPSQVAPSLTLRETPHRNIRKLSQI